MKFGVLIPLLLYYGTLILVFTFGVFPTYDTQDVTDYFNNNTYNTPQNSFDWLDYGMSLVGFIGIGVGLPDDTPYFIQVCFTVWTIIINIIAVALVIQVIRGS